MSGNLRKCVVFAKWCSRWRLNPVDAGELLALSHRAFKAGERECNVPGKSADPQRRRVEAKAKEMRLQTVWPGLLPMFRRRGQNIYLPEVH